MTLEPNCERMTGLCGLEEKPSFIDQLCVDQTPSRGKAAAVGEEEGAKCVF